MKKIIIFFLVFTFINNSQAQHKISAYGGWTMSKIQKRIDPALKKGAIYDEFYAFPILHAGYMGLEYEYDWKFFRFSTGLSYVILGSSEFVFRDTPWETWYITVPVIGGVKWDLPHNFGLTLEAGVEVGFEIATGILVSTAAYNPWGNVNAVLGVEANWKQFRFGTRLQYGLTKFRIMGSRQEITLRHSALTTYIGYTLWDSEKAHHRRAKRLSKKHLEIE